MEAIWTLADSMGVRVITDPGWHYEDGAFYLEEHGTGIILMPSIIPIELERWLIAHELGHHVNPVYRDPRWLAEAKADRWAVASLLELYHPDDIDWPHRVVEAMAERLKVA